MILWRFSTLPHVQWQGGQAAVEKTYLDPLTQRERDILRLLTNGLTDGEIAEQLVLTVGTVSVQPDLQQTGCSQYSGGASGAAVYLIEVEAGSIPYRANTIYLRRLRPSSGAGTNWRN
jgi:hypothetical protein